MALYKEISDVARP